MMSIANSFFGCGAFFITTPPCACGDFFPCIRLHGGGGLFEGELPPNLISDFFITNFSPGGEIAGLIKPFKDVGLLLVVI